MTFPMEASADNGAFSELTRRTGSMGAVLGRFGLGIRGAGEAPNENGADLFCRAGWRGVLYLLPVED